MGEEAGAARKARRRALWACALFQFPPEGERFGALPQGLAGFDGPWWLRGGPSSQSSPVGRRGRTSWPRPCLSLRAGCAKVSVEEEAGAARKARRRALWARALFQFPSGGERLSALPQGLAGYDGPWWLRGGPSSQSSPVGRRGKTSWPNPCLSARAGCAEVLWGEEAGAARFARRRALWARALFQFPPEGERLGALPQGLAGFERLWWLRGGPSSQSSPVGRRGKTSRTHPRLSAGAGCAEVLWGEEAGAARFARRRARWARALFQFPPEGERLDALPQGLAGFEGLWWLRGGPSSQSSPVGRRGTTSRPHSCLSLRTGCAKVSAGRGGRSGAFCASARPLGACPLSVSPVGGKAWRSAAMAGGLRWPVVVARRPLISIFSRGEKRPEGRDWR